MHPSSLIFVVVIAIWAVYVMQYWLKRRDHLVTARSVDRFSEAMRVLEPRTASTPVEGGAVRPRSYAVSPARATRGHPTTASVGSAPEPELAGPTGAGAPAEGVGRLAVERPRTARPTVTPGGRSRRAAGLAFLVSLAATPATLLLAAVGLMGWAVPLLAVAATAASLLWVRREARMARRRAHVRPPAARRDPRSRTAGVWNDRAPGRGTRPATAPGRSAAPAGTQSADAATASADAGRNARDDRDEPGSVGAGVYDVEDADGSSAEDGVTAAVAPVVPAAPRLDEDDMPLTWDPVPVPRPTYTMKARAYRPEPAPVPVPAPSAAPTAVAEPDESSHVRRAVGD